MEDSLSCAVFPRAIVHFDGDSFFASVEQALNYTLKGRPVITGAERGAATSVSIEAKRLGLSRGMTLRDMREKCPELVVVSSDYTAYSIFARRMYAIVRRFTHKVEEYSIDECFADITHLADDRHSYESIAKEIQAELHRCLGITFGVGLGPTKVLAKTASKYRKPAGFTSIPACEAHEYLRDMPAGLIWGIGPSMSAQLRLLGVRTALDFASLSPGWLQDNRIGKSYRAIWHELRGQSVNPVALSRSVSEHASIMKTRTFSPPSMDKTFVYSQICKNIEKACARARAMGMKPREVTFYLKTQEFLYGRKELSLPVPSADPSDILKVVQPHFELLFRANTLYRATGVTLRALVPNDAVTADLFGEAGRGEERAVILESIDALNRRFGKDTVFLGASVQALKHTEPDRRKKEAKRQVKVAMSAEQRKKSIDLPFLGQVR